MATVAPSADQAAGMLQNLSLDSQAKTKSNLDLPEPNNKAPTAQIGTVDLKVATNGYAPSNTNNHAGNPVLTDVMDPSLCYFPNGYQQAYYYGGYDGTGGEWDDYSRYINQDGTTGVYGDNGSVMYHPGYGYAPYGPYSPATSPVPAAGHDGQMYGQQQYQYPSPYFSTMTPTAAPTAAPQVDLSSAAAAGQLPMSVDTAGINTTAVANGGGKGTDGSTPFKPDYQNSSFNTNSLYGRGSLPGGVPTSGYQDPGYGYDGLRSPIPWLDGQAYPGGPVTTNSFSSSMTNGGSTPSSRNQMLQSHSNVMGQTRPVASMGTTNGYMNRLYPSKLYGQYGNSVRTGMTYGSNGYYPRSNSRGWFPVDSKYKNRGRPTGYIGYGNDNMDGMNELNRGPRAKDSSKAPKAFTPVTLAVRGQLIPSTNGNQRDEKATLTAIPDKEQYNLSDFPDTYSDAKFFIIKSYSEDDIHKSIKYNVWSSTPNGNKKLDAAYREAQEKSGGCPVFLFFSVNASGQFVGLAEMVSCVDFEKSVEYWQQDKWNGNFSLKWHIVKDVPNSLLKHIILENNENKPVTNSRDTQEVKLEQGLQMIKLFKEHSSKTCILDDFGFYEGRQKTIQEKKAKQQQFQKQVWEGKNYSEKNKDRINGEKPQKVEVAPDSSSKEAVSPVAANGDAKLSENGSAASVGDATESVKPLPEKALSNGVANGY